MSKKSEFFEKIQPPITLEQKQLMNPVWRIRNFPLRPSNQIKRDKYLKYLSHCRHRHRGKYNFASTLNEIFFLYFYKRHFTKSTEQCLLMKKKKKSPVPCKLYTLKYWLSRAIFTFPRAHYYSMLNIRMNNVTRSRTGICQSDFPTNIPFERFAVRWRVF